MVRNAVNKDKYFKNMLMDVGMDYFKHVGVDADVAGNIGFDNIITILSRIK